MVIMFGKCRIVILPALQQGRAPLNVCGSASGHTGYVMLAGLLGVTFKMERR
jgi:hypothetical protein